MLFTLRSFVLRFRRTINRETRVLSEDDFRKNLTEIKSRLANSNIVFLSIPMMTYDDINEMRHPYLIEDINIYNKILDEFGAVDLQECGLKPELGLFQKRTVHFNAIGHEIMSEVIHKQISIRLFE